MKWANSVWGCATDSRTDGELELAQPVKLVQGMCVTNKSEV